MAIIAENMQRLTAKYAKKQNAEGAKTNHKLPTTNSYLIFTLSYFPAFTYNLICENLVPQIRKTEIAF